MTPADGPYDLDRFVEAQAGDYDTALAELRGGRKRTHWIWYILPQLRGLGRSAMSSRYGIAGLGEARAYLAHPVLGARLRECVTVLNEHGTMSAAEILGDTDAQKFHSCVTLFAAVAEGGSPFHVALDLFFDGKPDAATVARLSESEETRARDEAE